MGGLRTFGFCPRCGTVGSGRRPPGAQSMRRKTLALAGMAAAAVAFAPTPMAAAAKAAEAARTYSPPRTPWGHPDLQGSYTTTDENGVPMERPDQFPPSDGASEQEFQRIVRERTDRARATAA